MNIRSLYPYEHDVITVTKYGDYRVEITYLSSCRVSGYESEIKYIPKSSVNDNKLSNNIKRAKTTIKALALSNPWEYFCSFTQSPGKFHDRSDLKVYFKKFAEFIHTLNRSRKIKIVYLMVPELHSDNENWHIHALISGLVDSDFRINKNGYLEWSKYADKFGFCNIDPIRDLSASSFYILKYITKESSKRVTDLGAHLYYCSLGLSRGEILFKGNAVFHGDWDWQDENGYVKKKTLDLRENSLEEYLEVYQ